MNIPHKIPRLKPTAVPCSLAFLLPLAAQAQAQDPERATAAKPKLVVLMVIDQFRDENLDRYRNYFGMGGFRRLEREGARMSSARYSHATTYTGPGHALIASGSYGHTSSIVGNRWFNRRAGRTESMFFDPAASILGVEASPKDDDTSPRNFAGNNLGDQMRLTSGGKSKVIGLSNKDRAAIMLAGKTGRALWFHEAVGGLTSSSFYGAALPPWAAALNARKLPEASFNRVWTALPATLRSEAEIPGQPDDFAFETDVKGLGRTFPHRLTDASGKPTTAFYEAWTATPFATDFQFEAARTAIEAEGLGADAVPDLLGLSLTAPDIAGHAYGADSREVRDSILRLDGQIAGFLDYLSRRFKRGEVVVALTADHGACPLPEWLQQQGIDAGRLKSKPISDAVEAALTARFGAPEGTAKWVLAVEDPGVFLNRDLMAARKLEAPAVERVAADAIAGVPGVAATFLRSNLINGQATGRWGAAMEKSFHAERSGDVLFQVRPFWITGSRETGTSHGSPYEYDNHVPLLFWGAGVRPGLHGHPVDVADLAPTLAALLGISAPAGSEGRALHEVLAR
jgi:predicted AlkP superfamily pyrophosphatase or phosphodiesterase